MNRYLLNLSFIGGAFRGLQRQINRKIGDDTSTVQGQVEIALKKLNNVNPSFFTVGSSRTDSGVHAFHSPLHVDLENLAGEPFEPEYITQTLNSYFNIEEIPIQVVKTYLVPSGFHCRYHANSRTYLYRLGVIRGETITEPLYRCQLPLQELQRSFLICTDTFDIDKAREACQLFMGLHDFRSFMYKSNLLPQKRTRRVIEQCEIIESPLLESFPYSRPFCFHQLDYKMYDIVIKGDGFLHKQVRRTVAALIAVAKGFVTLRDIKLLLQIPSRHYWPPKIKTAPPQGLYLVEVGYPEDIRNTFKEQL